MNPQKFIDRGMKPLESRPGELPQLMHGRLPELTGGVVPPPVLCVDFVRRFWGKFGMAEIRFKLLFLHGLAALRPVLIEPVVLQGSKREPSFMRWYTECRLKTWRSLIKWSAGELFLSTANEVPVLTQRFVLPGTSAKTLSGDLHSFAYTPATRCPVLTLRECFQFHI